MKLVLITTHAKESAQSLGIEMPDDHLRFIIENRIRKDLKKAIKVKQGDEGKWIVPLITPQSIFCDQICCWMVISEPNDQATQGEYQYVLRTFLHENSPIVRKYWHDRDIESPVQAYLKYWDEMNSIQNGGVAEC